METALRVQWVRRLSVVVVVLTFAIMVVGSWVKATGSGLACPDWPACYGQWLPPFPSADTASVDPANGQPIHYSHAQVLYEWTHRALVSVYTLPFVALALLAWTGRELDPWLRRLPAAGGIVLVAQIGLGGATVLKDNPAALTTAHLATATIIMVVVTATMCVAMLRPVPGTRLLVRHEPGRVRVVHPGEEA